VSAQTDERLAPFVMGYRVEHHAQADDFPVCARKARSASRRSASPRSAPTLALFDRLWQDAGGRRELPERVRDGDHTHADAGATKRLNSLVKNRSHASSGASEERHGASRSS
jgi:hypothetical protein